MSDIGEARLEELLAMAARCRWISGHARSMAFDDSLPLELRSRLRTIAGEAEAFRSYLISHRIAEEER